MNGIARARAKGQPMIPPVANSSVASSVRRFLFELVGSKAYENAKLLVYIVNEDGRKAIGRIRDNLKRSMNEICTCSRNPCSCTKQHEEEIIAPYTVVDFLHYGAI